ncbi:flagellar biosynthesis protein FlhA [Leptolinea tardivitalis]|uniref:Flagellar biosynthesis protein FlhA n=1 Tax=Leptolinea tardivitalis TaxID=229920 RepID=A0A0N8GKZ5_9CHLR|nr:flagellar biosynthesis protein FlhA [Leptolinea tardivitalis]KPL71074.1 flagellar biosynthesis protein FlhA [Leptolinea tardivitalis]GAP22492.1 flagellar biosynthesis protein FlhA [Leptolinea tardivitalis]
MATAKTTVNRFDWRTLLQSNDLVMAFGVVILVALMIVPIPSGFVDVLVILNLAMSLGTMFLSLYITRPMDFSIFPSMLLVITLFRLGLNISISRLILIDGDAGEVVKVFGNLVIGGNYVVGVVIFLMLMIIQFAVITNGAGRVAEVAARFTLDAMPGKQLSIDADLNAGIINEEQARARRKEIQTEADFYGSMDGASKFVRGDAIAAVIVIIVNIIGGFVIGMFQRNLSLMDALKTYTLLTVGSGLAVQIPSLLVSTAAGLIITRNANEGALGASVTKQLSNYNALLASAVVVGLMMFIPGLPKLPFILVAGVLGGGAYYVRRMEKKAAALEAAPAEEAPTAPLESPEEMMGMVVIDPLELEVGYGLIPLVDEERADNLLHQITNIRRQMLSELGFVLPVVRIRDNLRLPPQTYRLKIRGEEVARGELMIDRFLAIPGSQSEENLQGIATTEPAFGLPAYWISDAEKGRAELMNYTVVSPLAVLSTHLTEVIRSHASDLLSRQMVQEMLNQLKEKTPAAVEGVIPDIIRLGDVQDVLKNLLKERVPIRDLSGIIEVLGKHAASTRDPAILAEAVRQTMARTLSNLYREEDGFLHVFTLSPQLEMTLKESLSATDSGLGFSIDTVTAQSILNATGERMEALAQEGHPPVLLCPRELRLAFRRLVEQAFPNLVVLAFSEISSGTRVQAHGMVDLTFEKAVA